MSKSKKHAYSAHIKMMMVHPPASFIPHPNRRLMALPKQDNFQVHMPISVNFVLLSASCYNPAYLVMILLTEPRYPLPNMLR